MQPNDPNTSPTAGSTPDSNVEPIAAPAATSSEPQAAPVTPTPPAANSTPIPPAVPAASTTESSGFLKSKKAKIGALVAGFVVLLGGGGAAAYYGVILPSQPQRIAQQAISNTLNQEKVTSRSFEGEVTFTGGEVASTLSSLSFNGASSNQGALNLTVTANTVVTKINLDVRSTDSKTLYARLSGLDGLDQLLAAYAANYPGSSTDNSAAMLATLAPIITNINNQWYSVDESMLNQLGGGLGVATSENKITEADAQKVGEIYKKHQFLEISEKLADEKIHDIDSYHILAKINKDKLVAFLEEIKAANIPSLSVDQAMIDQVSEVDFSKSPIDIWVSKTDRLITQLATTIEQDGTTMKLRVALFDVNKEVKVETPTDAKTMLELLTEFTPLATQYMNGGAPATDTPLQLNEQ